MSVPGGTCEHCGAPLSPGVGMCEVCNQPISRGCCEQCGAALPPYGSFCEQCGSLISTTPAPRPARAAYPAPRARSGRGLLVALAIAGILICAAAATALWAVGRLAGEDQPMGLNTPLAPTVPAQVVVVTDPPPSATPTEPLPTEPPPTELPPTEPPATDIPPTPTATDEPATQPPPEPTATETAELPKGERLLADDLSGNHLGWTEGEKAETGTIHSFEGGKYNIRMTEPDRRAVGVPGAGYPDEWRYADFVFEADTALIEGANPQGYGLVFRYQDNNNHYLFEISALGDWHVVKAYQGTRVPLVDWADHPAIRSGLASNQLAVVARGTEFSFYVNGVQVGSASDPDVAEGKPGFVVTTWADGPAHATFANLSIWEVR